MVFSALFSILSLPTFLTLFWTSDITNARALSSKRDPVQCCPLDNFDDPGVLINVFPFFTCAYPDGACSWDSVTGQLENSAQENCQSFVSCENECECPLDNTEATGSLIAIGGQGIQCAYAHGACTFSEDGRLFNATGQTNCPQENDCVSDP